jgi:hypothetical protein
MLWLALMMFGLALGTFQHALKGFDEVLASNQTSLLR